jgi:hypothetical protein
MTDFEVSNNKDESLSSLYLDFRWSSNDYAAIYKKNSRGKRYLAHPKRPKYQVKAQYFSSDFDQAASYDVFGFSASYTTGRYSPYKFTYSMSTVGGDERGVTYPFGEVPEYTKMKNFNLSSLSAATTAMRFGVDYFYQRSLTLGLAFATFAGEDTGSRTYVTLENSHVESANIVDITADYNFNSHLSLDSSFEYQNLAGRGTYEDDVEDTMIVRVLATYKF